MHNTLPYGLLNRGEAYLIPTWLMREQRLAQVKINLSILTLCVAYAAAAPEEPFPTTAALLEKLQEVLEKADVEVLAIFLLSSRISFSLFSMLSLGAVCALPCLC